MTKEARIRIAILKALNRMPAGYPCTDDALQAEVCLAVQPRPTLVELENQITELEQSRAIVGTRNELTGSRVWMITETGRCALAVAVNL